MTWLHVLDFIVCQSQHTCLNRQPSSSCGLKSKTTRPGFRWGRLIPHRAAWLAHACKYVDMHNGAYRCLLPLLVRGHFKSELAVGGRGPGRRSAVRFIIFDADRVDPLCLSAGDHFGRRKCRPKFAYKFSLPT